MATFELAPEPDIPASQASGWAGLEARDLLNNARWFTRIRWVVVVLLLAGGLLSGLLPGMTRAIGLDLPAFEFSAMALALAAINLLYRLKLRRYITAPPRRKLVALLWTQILFDLGILTVLVHYSGSVTTFVSLAYLFHIVLACIFFAPPFSLLITLLSGLLFLTLVSLELIGVLAPRSILLHGATPPASFVAGMLHAISPLFFWLAVWYLVSVIAQAVRQRDRQLAQANEQLLKAEQENNRQVLRTTHDLKAPFSGIESNILLLRSLHWEEISEPVREIIGRIEARSAALRERIKDILLLGAIKSQEQANTAHVEPIDLRALLSEAISDVEEKAVQGRIAITLAEGDGKAYTDPSLLKTLLANLLANAVFYSHEGGTVSLTLTANDDRSTTVSITDQGIGIRDDALPHIFDEYYRTKEASQFNQMSTGLGLAIVKRIATKLELTIQVHSVLDHGTTFAVTIPRRTTETDPAASRR
ncbi:MAG: HAMP domain-containing histidine kinase [Lentisphaerae bacterium]|nr:HAMP domain-containing histidine kinase [Lentisphaerota bacterium]